MLMTKTEREHAYINTIDDAEFMIRRLRRMADNLCTHLENFPKSNVRKEYDKILNYIEILEHFLSNMSIETYS